MENKQLIREIENTTNPYEIVCKIEETSIPYNRQETYHTAHNMNKLRPIDYTFIASYSRDRRLRAHASAVTFCLDRGTTLERTLDRIRNKHKEE